VAELIQTVVELTSPRVGLSAICPVTLLQLLLCGSVTYWLARWLGGAVVRASDLRLEIAGSNPAVALSSANLDKLFTHTVQRL